MCASVLKMNVGLAVTHCLGWLAMRLSVCCYGLFLETYWEAAILCFSLSLSAGVCVCACVSLCFCRCVNVSLHSVTDSYD